MKIEDTREGFDLAQEYEQARQIYFLCKQHMLRLLNGLDDHAEPGKAAKEITGVGAEIIKALNILSKQEVDLGKQSKSIRGVLSGGALDLEDARTEILGRVARLRE